MPPKKMNAEPAEDMPDLVGPAPDVVPSVAAISPVMPMPDLTVDSSRRSSQLAQIPVRWANPPSELISKLPKGGTQLDYMGHADVTLALIQVDPLFEYGWLTNEDGSMKIAVSGDLYVLEGWMKVHGQIRQGVGTCEKRKTEYHKELIGDLLRNCAMRFGIATTLWSKAERHEWGAPQDPSAAKAFEMLRQETANLEADQRRSVREWWTAEYGDIPVSADAGFERIVGAITYVRSLTAPEGHSSIQQTEVDEHSAGVDALAAAFPGSEIVEPE